MRPWMILFLLAGCGSDDAPKYCAETSELVLCNGAENCAFDPAQIDCTVSCTHFGEACAGGCTIYGCSNFSMSACMTGCNATKNQACSNVSWGCDMTQTGCDAIGDCIASYQ